MHSECPGKKGFAMHVMQGEASFINGQKGRVTNEGQILLWTEPSTPQSDRVWSAMMVQVGKAFSNVDTL